ncbi:uncharacterized protein LOC123921330 isoform X1 [Trifolium pratense]|uniref:uncharacterized protein LOC123921330 isoform X1 n=2 Tax=Trifolium pratense TaxID=57577 RepID=UPI001E690DC2|nr:uncharacterized protein LOC123921330 isoform X1 [Trifolium pratense]
MEYLYGVASAVSRDLVCGVIGQLRYPCCFNKFVQDLAKEEGNLAATRDGVQDRVTQAKKQTRKTAEVVDRWLKDANHVMDDVDQLLQMAKTENNSCLGHCPNLIWRYRVGRKLANKKRDLKLRIEEGRQYIQIERPASLSAGYFSSEKCWEFDSRKPAYEELMRALEDDDVTMIGLYGMGGCGKTMLTMEVGKRCGHLFDQVVFVPISSTVDLERIQEKIAGSLEFEFQEKDEMDRSQRLCMRFRQEDRVLVILDDVWQMLDFDAIGIPSSEHHKGCKVLISSRSEAVCTLMDCQKKIHLSTLTNDETWDLFQKQALISECTSITVQSLARQISNECKGLPVAIVAVASSLKGKAEVEWKVALNRLRSSKPVNIEKGLQNPYTCLQLSYDNLDTEEAKSLFLLCSVFPEDCEIPVEFLTRSAIGLGIVGEVHSYEGARDEVSVAKNKLISSCLLLDVDEGKCVKMHDLVRNVAHWIAQNEIKCASKKDVMTLEHTSLRYLWCEKFPNNLYCSSLDFLHIHTLTQVSDETFKGMGMLRVLFLYNKGRERMPLLTTSLKSLMNLRCLLLSKWDLVDISFVGDMKKLESLTLCYCSFLELPDVVTELTNLRLLDLSECDMKMNPFEVIGRHRQLEELYFTDCRSKWEVEFLKEFSAPQVLQRYQIQLGSMFFGFQEAFLNHHRTLFLSYLDVYNAATAIKDLAEKAEVLCIAGIEGGAKSIMPDIFRSMNHLTELWIRDSKGIECLVDTCLIEVGTLFFCKLHWLRIEHMEHLGALYNGRMPLGGHFENLEDLYISHCPKLTCLFTLAVAQNLAQLENLQVLSCHALKHILIDDDDDREEIIVYDHRPLFPKLKRLHVRECSELEYIIPITLAHGLVLLECLEIVCNQKLRYIFGQSTHKAAQNQNQVKIELSALEELTLVMLPNINSICPEDCYLMWPSLLSFNLRNCAEFFMVSINTCMALHNNPMINEASHQTLQNIREVRVNNCELEGIFQLVGLPIDGEKDPLMSCLEMLYLENLPQLRYVCKSNVESTNIQFQNLQQMEICGCRRLKFIFSSFMAGGLPQLKALKVEKCNQLDQIVEDISTAIPLGSFGLPSLVRLTLISCPMLGSLFTASTAKTLTSLEELTIEDCHGLKQLVTYGRTLQNRRGEIVQDDHHDFQSYVSMFQSLKRISIMRCHLLKYILPVSFGRGLVKLEAIEITDTPELRYVFGHSSHQYPNKFKIELPALEKVALYCIPNLIAICPENYHATCSSLQLLVMNDVGLSMNNWMVDSGAAHSDLSSTKTDEGETSMPIEKKLTSVIIENGSEMEGIFQMKGSPSENGQQVMSWLEDLKLNNLPKLMYIWMGSIQHCVSLQHLHKIHICNCPTLKSIFSISVLRVLPLLKILVLEQCEELEQIIEDDDEENENVPNPQVWFSQLKFLLVTQCNKLKHLFSFHTSHEFPELEYLTLNQNSSLVQVFKVVSGVREGTMEILLPKLKHVMLMQLPNLNNICQGIEFQTLTNLLVHNCPKFLLTSTTTNEDMLQTCDSDKEIGFYLRPHLHDISCTTTNDHEFLTSKIKNKGIQDLQSQEQKLSLIPLPNLTEEFVKGQSMDEPYLTRQQKPLGESRFTEEETASKNVDIVALSIHSESDSSHSSPLATSQSRSHPHYEISFSQTETYTNKENKDRPVYIGDSEDNDLKPVKEDDESQIATPCVSEATAVCHSTEYNFVEKALSDLEESLRIPLRDIASSEANSLRLLTTLNFLSHLSLKDVALSDGLQAVIDTMHTEFPTILRSFKQAFSITDKFAMTDAHHDEVAITLASKISNAESFLNEAQQREAALKEQIIQLEKEVKCLQEENEKCIQETIGYKMELENVVKDKYEILEDQMKARQQIFEVDYKWSALLSQFQYNHIVARNPS